jgi:hypothetical protein
MERVFPVTFNDERIQRDIHTERVNADKPASSPPDLLTGLNYHPQSGLAAIRESFRDLTRIPGLSPVYDPRTVYHAIVEKGATEEKKTVKRGELPASAQFVIASGHYHFRTTSGPQICEVGRTYVGAIAFGSERSRLSTVRNLLGKLGASHATDNPERIATAWFISEDMPPTERKERADVIMRMMLGIARSAGLTALQLADTADARNKHITVVEQSVNLVDHGFQSTDEVAVEIGPKRIPAIVYRQQIS